MGGLEYIINALLFVFITQQTSRVCAANLSGIGEFGSVEWIVAGVTLEIETVLRPAERKYPLEVAKSDMCDTRAVICVNVSRWGSIWDAGACWSSRLKTHCSRS